MFRHFQTIKVKLIFAVAVFILLMVGVTAANMWLDTWKSEVEDVALKISYIDTKLHESDKLEMLFFTDDAISADFYESDGESALLERRKAVVKELIDALHALEQFDLQSITHASNDIQHTVMMFRAYESTFEELVALVKERGFENYGLEGEMRRSIHLLENSGHPLNMEILLSIRRHEKDFIIRKDVGYQRKVKNEVNRMRDDIERKVRDSNERDRLEGYLDSYLQSFTEYVWAEERIGVRSHSDDGLRKQLSTISASLDENLNRIRSLVLHDVETIRQNIRWGSIAVMMVCLVFGVLMAAFIVQAFGKPISLLSSSIHHVVESNFAPNVAVEKIPTKDELGRLSQDFSFMLDKVRSSLDEIRMQARSIEEKQEQLMDSIRYAQQIQDAILPSRDELHSFFKETMIIYLPQNVVSGDFYWWGERGNKRYFALIDCTGHGVPGAFMSMIGHTLLNKLVVQHPTELAPHEVLELLHEEVVAALRQDANRKNNDGMDLGLCCFEKQANGDILATFAGAKHSLFYSENGQLQVLEGVKRGIGGTVRKRSHKPFESRTAAIAQGGSIFFFSDGFPDQHNIDGQKYGTPQLLAYLEKEMNSPLNELEAALKQELKAHQGTQLQRDDITLVGMRV